MLTHAHMFAACLLKDIHVYHLALTALCLAPHSSPQGPLAPHMRLPLHLHCHAHGCMLTHAHVSIVKSEASPEERGSCIRVSQLHQSFLPPGSGCALLGTSWLPPKTSMPVCAYCMLYTVTHGDSPSNCDGERGWHSGSWLTGAPCQGTSLRPFLSRHPDASLHVAFLPSW